MKSNVTFDLVGAIQVGAPAAYPSFGVTPEIKGDMWTGLRVEVEHDDNATCSEIIDSARERVRDLLASVGVGRGLEPALGTVHVRSTSALESDPTTGQIQATCDMIVARPLRAMPSESLVRRLASDPVLRVQVDAVNAACASTDVVSRIRWSYIVLEQEQRRAAGYTPPDEFRHLRNGVSHPKLDDRKAVAYFQRELGADMPDLRDAKHLEFLKLQAGRVLQEAIRIVEAGFSSDEFWK